MFPGYTSYFLNVNDSAIFINGTLLRLLLKDSSHYQTKGMLLELFQDSYVSRLHLKFFLTSMNSDVIINGTLLRSLLKDSSPYQPKGMPLKLF